MNIQNLYNIFFLKNLYPTHYEDYVVLDGGPIISIRPLKRSDGPFLIEFYNSLSPISLYYRFFTPVKNFPQSTIAKNILYKLTQLDYEQEIALAAIQEVEGMEKILGVSQIIRQSDSEGIAEFAIVVRDPLQGRGVGAALFQRCLAIAKEKGIKKVFGIAMPDNTNMLALAKKFSSKLKFIPDANEYEFWIDLEQLQFEELNSNILKLLEYLIDSFNGIYSQKILQAVKFQDKIFNIIKILNPNKINKFMIEFTQKIFPNYL
ncbi:MAG: GNAT family N-acetyltransferase [Desulfobacterales bacterium]|nr:GNAT family N-acetyltransferase [Desulfobacterales bacterium]